MSFSAHAGDRRPAARGVADMLVRVRRTGRRAAERRADDAGRGPQTGSTRYCSSSSQWGSCG